MFFVVTLCKCTVFIATHQENRCDKSVAKTWQGRNHPYPPPFRANKTETAFSRKSPMKRRFFAISIHLYYSAKMPSSAPEAKSLPACELSAVKRM